MKKTIMSYEKQGIGVAVIEVQDFKFKVYLVEQFNEHKKIKSDQCASLEKASEIFFEWIEDITNGELS